MSESQEEVEDLRLEDLRMGLGAATVEQGIFEDGRAAVEAEEEDVEDEGSDEDGGLRSGRRYGFICSPFGQWEQEARVKAGPPNQTETVDRHPIDPATRRKYTTCLFAFALHKQHRVLPFSFSSLFLSS